MSALRQCGLKTRAYTENEALWEAWVTAEQLPKRKQQEFAATGSAMGLSLGQIILSLALVLPKGSIPSRATVGRWVAQASRQAGGLLAVLAQCCQRLVEAVQTEGVIKWVETALAIFRPDGELNDRQWAQEQLREANKPLAGPEWGKVRRLLSDERTLHYLD